ncbi:MAG: N-6 DNA methylase [Bacteroidaceae bacterium]|nr:N-6 DNA methylase [Bacteroidaceae bacterium]
MADGFKYNERAWAGQIIGWIKVEIENGTTVFKDVNNDASVKMKSGKTLFPDILLFTDKVSGIIFNGWELKYPDTPADDEAMLLNALEKARNLQSHSFVTWNGAEAIIWGIPDENYELSSLRVLKRYAKDPAINKREDLALKRNYERHESDLRRRALEILHDLQSLFLSGELKPAVNISADVVLAVRQAADRIIPQFTLAIKQTYGADVTFRKEYKEWKRYESATLRMLESSSRRPEDVDADEVLARFVFYNLIGKILFYLVLSENLAGRLQPFGNAGSAQDIKAYLNAYFEQAKSIDYQAIFKPYFTDCIPYSDTVSICLRQLLAQLGKYDFSVLPASVVGHILENLVPDSEKQKFGQYFTPECLANLVAFPAARRSTDNLFDPTSGTGSFLTSFYDILQFYHNTSHAARLKQIWGNDISHFPAILSVISLYKQNARDKDNFPRVIRGDFFNLNADSTEVFPDPVDSTKKIEVPIPQFDGIASNLPFIQQEDIPGEKLSVLIRQEFKDIQRAFLKDGNFSINERSDYFTYCVYHATKFLRDGGVLSVITSNAWLGKAYGVEFKRFLLDNYNIRYVVRSNAEHWFTTSQVSTIFFVLEKKAESTSAKFVTLNFKLADYFNTTDTQARLQQIEDLYDAIDTCESDNRNWQANGMFPSVYNKCDGNLTVSIVGRDVLEASLTRGENWQSFFVAPNVLDGLGRVFTKYSPNIIDSFRGERTGWDKMFVIPQTAKTPIHPDYLLPYIKGPTQLSSILFDGDYKSRLFVCDTEERNLDKGTLAWVKKFENQPNKNNSQTVSEANRGHKPYWYSLRPHAANILTLINPHKRHFFAYCKQDVIFGQRLTGIKVKNPDEAELIAALLNCTVSYLVLEMKGTSRNLGALDLNADFFKDMNFFNPALLSPKQKDEIVKAFRPLQTRKVLNVDEEVLQADRRNLDETIFRTYNLPLDLLEVLRGVLVQMVQDRVSLAQRTQSD